MPSNRQHLICQFRLKENMARQHTFVLKCITFNKTFASKVMRRQHIPVKQFKVPNSFQQKQHLIWIFTSRGRINVYLKMQVHVCGLICILVCMDVDRNVSVCASLTRYPSSLAYLAPCGELLWCLPAPAPWLPVSSSTSISCLQEGPDKAPFFHLLWYIWCLRVADHSWPVAMAHYCWCSSPWWPQQVVQQSTGLLKPLVQCQCQGAFSFFVNLKKYKIFHVVLNDLSPVWYPNDAVGWI